jgi:hypothetical protein
VTIDDLMQQYGPDAVITVRRPYKSEGDGARWVVLIDGTEVPGVEARTRELGNSARTQIVYLELSGSLIEFGGWSGTDPTTDFVRTLRGLQEVLSTDV